MQSATCTTTRLTQETRLPLSLEVSNSNRYQSPSGHLSPHSFNKHSLGANYIRGIVLHSEDKKKSLLSRRLHFSTGQTNTHTHTAHMHVSVWLHVFVCVRVCWGNDSKSCNE